MCTKISLHLPAGKMVFSLSGSCWLKWNKREKYFKDDTGVGEIYFFLLSHFITCSCLLNIGIRLLFISVYLLPGWKKICHFDLLGYLSQSFFISAQSHFFLFNQATDWRFTHVKVACLRGDGKSDPMSSTLRFLFGFLGLQMWQILDTINISFKIL